MYCKSTYFGVGVFLVFVTDRFTISYFENYTYNYTLAITIGKILNVQSKRLDNWTSRVVQFQSWYDLIIWCAEF